MNNVSDENGVAIQTDKEDLSEELQLIMVKQDGLVIQHIKILLKKYNLKQ